MCLKYILIASSLTIFFPIVPVNANQTESQVEVEQIEENVVKQNFSLEDFLGGTLSVVPEIIDLTQEVVLLINNGEYNNALSTVAGAIGLVDPIEEANSVGVSLPAKNSSEETNIRSSLAQLISENADIRQSQVSQILSQIVFSETGQDAIAQQNQILLESQEAATLAQDAALEAYESNDSLIQDSIGFGDSVMEEANDAQSAKASQDVLKAIASQADYESQILINISEQIGILTETQVYNGLHLKGLNTQLTINNQREQNIQTYLASNGIQMAEIDNNLEQQLELFKKEQEKNILQSQAGTTKIFLPGLFSTSEGL